MDIPAFLKNSTQLIYFTLGWNVITAITGISAGIYAGSMALTAFGLVNVVVIAPAGMLLWRLRNAAGKREGKPEYSANERMALFVAGIAFFLLSLYLLNESGTRLFYQWKPEVSVTGLVLAFLSVFNLPMLSLMKFRAAKTPGSGPLRVDAKRTLLCGYLALILLAGLGCNAWLGWWWADPAAVVLMVPFIAGMGWRVMEESKESSGRGAEKQNF